MSTAIQSGGELLQPREQFQKAMSLEAEHIREAALSGARQQIERLAKENLIMSPPSFDFPNFVDQLFCLAEQLGSIYCTYLTENSLRFRSHEDALCDVILSRARCKVRMICARLSVACEERGSREVSPYGDTVEFPEIQAEGSSTQRWSVHFMNTPDKQEFTITAHTPTA